jgi:Mannosyltransferase (PIG-V)
METTSEQLDSPHQTASSTTADHDTAAVALPRSPSRRTTLLARAAPFRQTILIYLGTRMLLLVVAILDGLLRHHSLTHELANWDGLWYRELANNGYPGHVTHVQSTLGFFPLYPIVIYAVAQPLQLLTAHSAIWSITVAGVIVSMIGGLIAAVLMQKLATGWWGEQTGRRAAALFCLFPGSVVFSMVYAEGLLIPLAAGCILALERRRWLLAGILAAFATASEPEALILILVCAVSAARELHRRGWRNSGARRSLLAPLLSLTGVGAFAVYLWAHTGTPLASFHAQHYGWNEKTDPLALVHLARSLVHEISFAHFNHPTINLNLAIGLLGAVVLIVLLVLLARARRGVSVEAIVWTIGISFLALTSEYTPPNPRLLITAFPAILVMGYYARGWRYGVLAFANGALLAGMSALTFIGTTLRP